MSTFWHDIYRNSKRLTIIPPSVLDLNGAVLVQWAVPGINDWMPLSIVSPFARPGLVHLSEVIQIYLPVMVKIESIYLPIDILLNCWRPRLAGFELFGSSHCHKKPKI